MPFPSNQGKIEGLGPLATVPQACAKNGVDAIVQKIFGELVAGLPPGGRQVSRGYRPRNAARTLE